MVNSQTMRIVFWNILHGGGKRAGGIVKQILQWNPDIVALAEFRDTPPSRSIAKSLYDVGYIHQLSTIFDDEPTWNALFVASRIEISKACLIGGPEPDYLWMPVKVHTKPSLHIGVILVPLGNQWYEYLDALVGVANDWQLEAGVIIGDTNSALTGLDEDTADSADFKDRFVAPLTDLGMARHVSSNSPYCGRPDLVFSIWKRIQTRSRVCECQVAGTCLFMQI